MAGSVAGLMAGSVAGLVAGSVGGSVGESLGGSVGESLGGSVGESLGGSVGGSLGEGLVVPGSDVAPEGRGVGCVDPEVGGVLAGPVGCRPGVWVEAGVRSGTTRTAPT